MNNITYIFKEGRAKRLLNSKNFPKEFFYSYIELSENINNKTKIIELKNNKNTVSIFLFKLIRKLLKLPIYTEKILTLKNLITIYKSTHIINTNQNIGYATLPILMIFKIFKKINVTTFIMGFIDNESESFSKKILNLLLIKVSDNLIFLGEGEYKVCINKFKAYSERFHLIPFCVDTDFWKNDKKNKKEFILFIGNDKNRDYDFLSKLINEIDNINFVVISSRMNKVNKENVIHIKGDWNSEELSDLEIRDYYSKSLFTILPLKESLQPSGQSVALQSMSMETPVLITKTSGFWDYENFKNNENIFFLNNKTDEWIRLINKLVKNKNISENLSKNAYKVVKNSYSTKNFTEKFSKIIF